MLLPSASRTASAAASVRCRTSLSSCRRADRLAETGCRARRHGPARPPRSDRRSRRGARRPRAIALRSHARRVAAAEAAQSATRTPATQMAPKAATTTAVVIPLPSPARTLCRRRRLYTGCVGRSASRLPEQRGVRYTPRPQVAGIRSLPLVCHDYSTESVRSSVPTVNQLVRKGRKAPVAKTKTPALAERTAEARRLHARLHDHPEEAELGAAQGRARPADERDGGRRLHSRRGAQPAGALGRPHPRRPRQGPARASATR